MRQVRGYVFLPKTKEFEFIFGRPIFKELGIPYECLETNGLVPYESADVARGGAEQYMLDQSVRPVRVNLATLGMQIQENAKDLEIFRKKSNLVVIMESRSEPVMQTLLGASVDNKPRVGHLPGMELGHTGYKTFKGEHGSQTPFDRASNLAEEVRRQGECRAYLAIFKLKNIAKIL